MKQQSKKEKNSRSVEILKTWLTPVTGNGNVVPQVTPVSSLSLSLGRILANYCLILCQLFP